MTAGRRSVTVIDTWMTEAFPTGKCARALVAALAPDHDVTAVSLAFDDPTEGRAQFVRVRAVKWPAVVLLPTFWVAAGLAWWWGRLRGRRPDTVIAVEGYSPVATVRYAHLCHALYRAHVPPAQGLRGLVQRISTPVYVAFERLAYRRAQTVVAVSDGLADDLERAYPHLAGRITVIPNFIDVESFPPPPGHDRDRLRSDIDVASHQRLLVFVALGHFERKGLPELFSALAEMDEDTRSRLVVAIVGGFPERVRELRGRADGLGIGKSLRFVGMVDDARPYYWAADAFVFPSRYETFSFVAFEAAAAGLPLIATPVYGVRDILVDGETGWQIETDAGSVRAALAEVATVDVAELQRRGAAAQAAAARFDRPAFNRRWRTLVDGLPDGPER